MIYGSFEKIKVSFQEIYGPVKGDTAFFWHSSLLRGV